MTKIAALIVSTLLLSGAASAHAGEHAAKAETASKEKTGCSHSAQECVDHLAKTLPDRGWMGVELEPAEGGGWTIRRVVEDSPAARAGLAEGDVLLAVNGVRYGDEAKMGEMKSLMKPGSTLTYTVGRSGSERPVQVELGEMPEQVRHQIVGAHMVHEHADRTALMAAAGYGELSIEDVEKLAKAGKVHVFDANGAKVRETYGVIPKAKLLTSAVDYDTAWLPADKSAKLVFYCANTRCTASDEAAKRAVKAGYADVHVLRAGIAGWKEAGKPVDTAPRS